MGHDARVPDVRRIAVVRANAIGDYLFCEPALAALRAAYAGAEIVLLGDRWHGEFLRSRPGPVDRVIPVPAFRGVRDPGPGEAEDRAEQEAFLAAMRAERFDIAVQLHGGGRFSNPFTTALGARVSVGLRARDAPPLDRWVRYVYYQPEIFRFLEVVGLVGARPVRVTPHVTVTAADRAEAAAAVPESGQPLVLLHPGARDTRRRWPAERFAAVGDALAAYGARIVVSGTAAEDDVVRAVLGGLRHAATPLVGAVSLGGLVGVLARCRLVMSNDTGPRHLAEAVGTATVSVYWCGNLISAGPVWRRQHRPHVSWTTRCPVCGADATGEGYAPWAPDGGCRHGVSFVSAVPTAPVIADALELYRANRLRSPGGSGTPLPLLG